MSTVSIYGTAYDLDTAMQELTDTLDTLKRDLEFSNAEAVEALEERVGAMERKVDAMTKRVDTLVSALVGALEDLGGTEA